MRSTTSSVAGSPRLSSQKINVRPPRQRANFDLLLAPDEAGGHRRIHGIHQRAVAHAERLHDRRRVHAGGRSERVGADDGIVVRDRHVARAGDRQTVRRQRREIAIDIPHHHQVDEQQIDRRVAAPLADAERGAVQPRRAGLEGRDARRDAESTIPVAVPVDADVRGVRVPSAAP